MISRWWQSTPVWLTRINYTPGFFLPLLKLARMFVVVAVAAAVNDAVSSKGVSFAWELLTAGIYQN